MPRPERERYGPHIWEKSEYPMGSDSVFMTCILCHAVTGAVGNCAPEEPTGGINRQADPKLCGGNRLSRTELLKLISSLEKEIEGMRKKTELDNKKILGILYEPKRFSQKPR